MIENLLITHIAIFALGCLTVRNSLYICLFIWWKY